MADLASLRELYVWMRQEKILYARTSDLELRLEPEPPATLAPQPQIDSPIETDEDVERRSLEDLLYSAGVDPAPFLAMRRNA